MAAALENRGWAVSSVTDSERARWLVSVRAFHAVIIAESAEPWAARTLAKLRTCAPTPMLAVVVGGERCHRASFELGADMVTDAGSSDDLIAAAVSALVRRSEPTAPVLRYLESDGLMLDVHSRRVHVDGKETGLSPIEFELLQVLMTHPQAALRHQMIIKVVWNWKYGEDRNALRIQINRLRKKLNDLSAEPRFIRSLRSYGYSFIRPVSQLADDFSSIGGDCASDRVTALAGELRRLGRGLQTAPSLKSAIELLVSTVVERDVCDAAAVLTRDQYANRLTLTAQSGMPREWIRAVADGIPLNHGGFISAETVLTGQAFHIVDITAAPQRYASSARLLKAAQIPVMLSIPLADRHGVWGQLGYSARSDRAFTPAHVMLLEGAGLILGTLAQHAGPTAADVSIPFADSLALARR